MVIAIQESPGAPSYTAESIKISAATATPQATMEGVKAQQGELNAVNTLSGGRSRRIQGRRKNSHKSFIRTYKGRRYIPTQKGGQIVVPQVGSTCSEGPQCAGAQNASLTSLNNQAKSNSINDAYATQSGGRKQVRFGHVTRHRSSRSSSRKPRHDHSLTSTIVYNIKKVMRKVFS